MPIFRPIHLSEIDRQGLSVFLYRSKANVRTLKRAHLSAIACSPVPDGHDHWTLRMLASKAVELGFVEHMRRKHRSVQEEWSAW